MKKILAIVFIGCLVMILGFPKPAFADHLDSVLASLNQNHQAIGSVIPDIHTLQVPPSNQMVDKCINRGLSDLTIFRNTIPQLGSNRYGCATLYDLYFLSDPKNSSLRLSGPPNSENWVVDIPTSSVRHGRYFTRQYPEFAIIGASVVDVPYHLNVAAYLGSQYDGANIVSKTIPVGGNAVVWQKIASNSPGIPWVHQLFIVENASTSTVGFGPSGNYVSKEIPEINFVRDARGAPKSMFLSFTDFYYVLFGSYSDKIDEKIIKAIVDSIITGKAPQYAPVRNPNFQLPKLTRQQQTNLPINVSGAFTDPNGDRLYYQIRATALPSGLKFDATKNQIVVDTSNGQPYGPGPKTAGKWLIPITVYDYDPKNPNGLPNHKNNTVTEYFELEIQ